MGCLREKRYTRFCAPHYKLWSKYGESLTPPPKKPRPCAGCGALMQPAPGERNARKWCSGACRARVLYPQRRDAGLTHFPSIKVRFGDCAACGGFICRRSSGGVLTCGAACRKALKARRQRERYAADPAREVARLRKVRSERTEEQIAADSARLRAYKDRVGRMESTKAGEARRRARKKQVPTEKFLHRDVFDRDAWVCGICAEPVDRDLAYPHPMSVSLDHVIPISLGGPHTMANTRCSHLSCNVRRNNRMEEVSDAG